MFDPIWAQLRFWRKLKNDYKSKQESDPANKEYWIRQETLAEGVIMGLTLVLDMLGFKNVESTE